MLSTFVIRILGTVGNPFAGTLRIRDGSGESYTHMVSGCVPDRFVFQGTEVTAEFQKGRAAGVLQLELMENGERVSAARTTSSYGSVTVARASRSYRRLATVSGRASYTNARRFGVTVQEQVVAP